MSRIILVDENDTPIGYKERDDITKDDMYRVSGLWVTNSRGEVLLSRRSLQKKTGPGKWGPAAAGTVDEGEDYLINIVKEAEEEIGLEVRPEDLRLGPYLKIQGNNLHFAQWYYYTCDLPIEHFVLREEEVMDIKWVSMEEFLLTYQHHPEAFSGAMGQWLPKVLDGQTQVV